MQNSLFDLENRYASAYRSAMRMGQGGKKEPQLGWGNG